MKRKFLLLTLMCILMGGLSSLFAQDPVTIDGTVGGYTSTGSSNYVPFNTKYEYTTSQQIYLKEELGGIKSGDQITKVAFHVKNVSGSCTRTIKIYMANITEDRFSTTTFYPFLMSTEDLVLSETSITIDAKNKWYTLELTKAFNYTGNNILFCVQDVTGSAYKYNNSKSNVTFDAYRPNEREDGVLVLRQLYKYASASYDPTAKTTSETKFAYPNVTTTSGYNSLNWVQFTYSSGGGSADTPAETPTPTAPTLNYPYNSQENVFNPFLRFTLGDNTTHYQISMGTGTEMTPLTDWVEKTIDVVDFQTSDLEPNTTYTWKVVAKNDKNDDPKTTDSETWSFTTKQFSYPGQIEGAYPNGEQGLVNPKFTWTFGDDTEEYQVIIDGEAKTEWTNPGSYTTGSYQTSGLSAGEHTWRIDARNIVGTTTGTEYSFKVASLPDNVTPLSPANGATGVTSDIVRFQFAEGTTDYRLLYSNTTTAEIAYISVKNGGTGNTWTSTGGATEMEFTIPGFGLGKTLYWAVEVKNAIGERSAWGTNDDVKAAIYSFTAASSLPVANAYPEDGAFNLSNPTLRWNFKGNVTHYQVYIGTSENNLEGKGWEARGTEGTGLVGEGSYQTADLTPATKYFWRVDVKEGETVLAGDVWSFITKLEAPVAQADPAQVVPEFNYNYGGTTIQWNTIKTALGYNVYSGDTKLNTDLINTNYFQILANDMNDKINLSYNMNPGYKFTVEAVYEVGGQPVTATSEDVIVKVTGTGYLQANIHDNDNQHQLEGATITLTCTRDEFGNEYSGNEIQYVLTTDAQGHYYSSTEGNERIQNGTYAVSVTKADYASYNETLTINNNATTQLEVTLKMDPSLYFAVSLREVSLNSATIYLENADWSDLNTWGDGFTPEVYFGEANYFVYLKKNGGEPQHITTIWFGQAGESAVKYVYEGWSDLGKGKYQIGVARRQDVINWSPEYEINYDVFEVEGDWNTAANWRDLELPKEDAEVYLLAPVTIAAEKDVTAGTVNIEHGGSLTINGSLTAGAVYNNTLLSAMQINDGGQLRQSNQNLKGKFVMNINNPSDWNTENIEGWQFVAAPFTKGNGQQSQGVELSQFIDAQGNYDLYMYDGDNDLWRNHKHVYGEGEEAYAFGTEFKLGTAYLASLESATTATFSGTFNAATTHEFEVSYTPDNRAANFHLLGNPFTFDINTAKLQAAGLERGYAVINAEGYDYEYFVNGTIPVGNGFFVFANEATASLRYAEVRGAAEATDNINIVARGEAGSNNVVINFGEGEGFPKLEGFNKEVANIYVANAGNKYAIYNCESNVNEVELTFVAKQMGSYSLSFDLNGEFESVVLVDRLTGVETDMIAEGEYNFIASSEDMKNRFVVRFANGQSTTANSQFVYQSGDELIINAEGAIEIIDMMGRVVYSSDVKVNRVNVSNFNNAAYVVRALNEGKVQKVVIY